MRAGSSLLLCGGGSSAVSERGHPSNPPRRGARSNAMPWSVRMILGMCAPVVAAAARGSLQWHAPQAANGRVQQGARLDDKEGSPHRVAYAARAFPSNATASWGKEPMVMSDKGPPNLLPPFFFHRTLEDLAGAPPAGRPGDGLDCPMCGEGWKRGCDFNEFADSCPEDLMGPLSDWPDVSIPNQGGTAHTLPYLMMDDMNCKRNVSGAADAIILEDSKLRVAVLPQSGGKVWSIYDKVLDKQLIFNNPAHQPMTVGARGAWTSGGVEWNYSPGIVGHSVFSDDDVHAALLETERGPLLRIWEFDRFNASVWQVDMMVFDGVFWAHPKITNPNSHDLPAYWWTCVGQRSMPDVRVVTPADLSIFPCTDWPYILRTIYIAALCLPLCLSLLFCLCIYYIFRSRYGNWFPGNSVNASFRGPELPGFPSGHPAWAQDMSFLGNVPQPHDFFMHKAGIETHWPHRAQQPYIATVHSDGFTTVHGHQLNGTKYFTWGEVEYARFVADFMSASDYENPECNTTHYDPWCTARGPHLGDYIEAQIGPAASQSHVFPLLAQSEYQWTEFYSGWQADKKTMQDIDYNVPLREVQAFIDGTPALSTVNLSDMQSFLKRWSSVPPQSSQVVHTGKPWGGLQEMLTGRKLASGVAFRVPQHPSEVGFDEARPWSELVSEAGTFSQSTLGRTPLSYQTRPEWEDALRKSGDLHGYTWLHRLHLGVMLIDRGSITAGELELNESMSLRPNVVAARNLALLAPSSDVRVARYATAWRIWKDLPSTGNWSDSVDATARVGLALAKEIQALLSSSADWSGLRNFHIELAQNCPACIAADGFGADRYFDAKASLLISEGDYASAIQVLTSHCFASYLGERPSLVNKWYHAMYMLELERRGHRNMTRTETVRFKRRIGCLSGDDTTLFTAKSDPSTGLNTDWALEWWTGKGPCNRGPPNLGNGPGAG